MCNACWVTALTAAMILGCGGGAKEGDPGVRDERPLKTTDGDKPTKSAKSKTNEELIADLRAKDLVTRMHAAKTLHDRRAKLAADAAPALADCLRERSDPNVSPKLRETACILLSWIGPGAVEAIPQLEGALNDDVGTVRHQAVAALAKIGKPATAALISALTRGEPKLKLAAAQALERIGSDAKEAAGVLSANLSAAATADERVVYAAALVHVDPEHDGQAVDALMACAKDRDDTVRLRAVKALCDLGPRAGKALMLLKDVELLDINVEVKRAAAEAIKKIQGN
jgi:HEAT repeat protein